MHYYISGSDSVLGGWKSMSQIWLKIDYLSNTIYHLKLAGKNPAVFGNRTWNRLRSDASAQFGKFAYIFQKNNVGKISFSNWNYCVYVFCQIDLLVFCFFSFQRSIKFILLTSPLSSLINSLFSCPSFVKTEWSIKKNLHILIFDN
jgi:hypothetical protein